MRAGQQQQASGGGASSGLPTFQPRLAPSETVVDAVAAASNLPGAQGLGPMPGSGTTPIAAAVARHPPLAGFYRLPGPSLVGCLQRFTREERLGGKEQWVCGACATAQAGVKQLSLRRLPPLLVLHAKRFEHTGGAPGPPALCEQPRALTPTPTPAFLSVPACAARTLPLCYQFEALPLWLQAATALRPRSWTHSFRSPSLTSTCGHTSPRPLCAATAASTCTQGQRRGRGWRMSWAVGRACQTAPSRHRSSSSQALAMGNSTGVSGSHVFRLAGAAPLRPCPPTAAQMPWQCLGEHHLGQWTTSTTCSRSSATRATFRCAGAVSTQHWWAPPDLSLSGPNQGPPRPAVLYGPTRVASPASCFWAQPGPSPAGCSVWVHQGRPRLAVSWPTRVSHAGGLWPQGAQALGTLHARAKQQLHAPSGGCRVGTTWPTCAAGMGGGTYATMPGSWRVRGHRALSHLCMLLASALWPPALCCLYTQPACTPSPTCFPRA